MKLCFDCSGVMIKVTLFKDYRGKEMSWEVDVCVECGRTIGDRKLGGSRR